MFETYKDRERRQGDEARRAIEMVVKLTRSLEAAVDECDEAQEAVSQIYYVVTGRSPEWSNKFGMVEAVEEITDAVNVLKAVAAASPSPPQDGWRTMESAPKDGTFVLLSCAEDRSRWLASWSSDRWYGVDEMGLTRTGHSAGDKNFVTGWAVTNWQPLPSPPASGRAKK